MESDDAADGVNGTGSIADGVGGEDRLLLGGVISPAASVAESVKARRSPQLLFFEMWWCSSSLPLLTGLSKKEMPTSFRKDMEESDGCSLLRGGLDATSRLGMIGGQELASRPWTSVMGGCSARPRMGWDGRGGSVDLGGDRGGDGAQ